MPHIQQLSSHVADLIAAGEVVERPASVVKELVENAIDAGSSAIVVEIQRGGMSLIRVTDNGCGIAPEELPTAFLRHATSKLRTAEDLARIGTLGFRGEALAAISAVSRVDVLTRRPEDAVGAALHGEGGHMEPVREEGAPEGTTIRVADLFYNTPARLKFMKKDSAETAAVAGLMQHLALSHPDISFKFIKDGQEALHTPGDGKLESAVYAALGREFARTLVPVDGRGGDITVRGFVTAPVNGRGSRSMQVFFVNGRFIKSQVLTAALEEGYRNQLLKGRFPGCVLEVTLPVTAVDVNVHPAKTQVKFAREHDVFEAVFHTVMDALDARGGAVSPVKPANQPVQNPRQDFFQSMDAKSYREQGAKPAAAPSAPVRPVFTPQPPKADVQPVFNPPPVKPAEPARPVWNTEWRSTAKVADSVQPIWPPRGAVKAAQPSALGKAPASVTARPETATATAPAPKPFVRADGCKVYTVQETIAVYDAGGKLLKQENIIDYTKENILGQFGDLHAFIHEWNAAEKKQAIADVLAKRGVDLDKLKQAMKMDDVDDFDFICHVAYDQKPLTRRERAEGVKRRDFLSRYSGAAREVLETLLESYKNLGIKNIEKADVLRMKDFQKFGTPGRIGKLFNGKKGYEEAVRALEQELYKAG